jgi:hypothetical protein
MENIKIHTEWTSGLLLKLILATILRGQSAHYCSPLYGVGDLRNPMKNRAYLSSDCGFLASDTVHSCRWIATFRMNLFLKPSGLYKTTHILAPPSSTLKKNAAGPPETITTTRHHSPEGHNLKSH